MARVTALFLRFNFLGPKTCFSFSKHDEQSQCSRLIWLGVLSIMPKIPKISVGIQMERCVSIRILLTGIFGITSEGGPHISVGIFRPKFAVPFLTNRFFALIREFDKRIQNDNSHLYWLARFNRKMSFHLPQGFLLISDRSVWHNGKHPWSPRFLGCFHYAKDSGNFGREFKWKSPFRFLLIGTFGTISTLTGRTGPTEICRSILINSEFIALLIFTYGKSPFLLVGSI